MTVTEVESDLTPCEVVPELPRTTGSQFARWKLSTHDVLVLVAGAVFCVGTGPFEFSSWTPRMAALLAGLPLGMALLVRLAWHRDKAALAALGFLAWGLAGALASAAPMRSFLGQVDGNTQSVVMFAGVFGFWALARTLSERGKTLVGPVLVGALGVSALVGILQIVLDLRSGMLGAFGGRAGGLEGNAVYFSTSLCGAIGWCASTALSAADSRARRISLVSVGYFGLAIGLSGSRVSIIAIVVVCAAVCWRARTLRSLKVPTAAVLGLIVSLMMQRSIDTGADSVQRFSGVGSEGRPDLWRAALAAFREHPVLGWGLGRVRPAIQHFFSPEFVRLYQQDDYSATWTDVHNVVIQMLVSVGVIGVMLLLLFVVLANRGANFALALAAVAISLNWLLQPTGLYSLALASVFLGAAGSSVTLTSDRAHRWLRAVTVCCAVVGLSAALYLIVADLRLRHAVDRADQTAIRSAAAWFGDDPFVIDIFVVDSYSPKVASDRAPREASARRLTELEPDVPTWWSELAMTQYDNEDFTGMRSSIDKALALQPNHVRSWVQLVMYARKVGDDDLAATARHRACDLGAPVCDPVDADGGGMARSNVTAER
ncbi:MAG: O-antigen ligase family protein [Ilumatobacteraceae bacterium]